MVYMKTKKVKFLETVLRMMAIAVLKRHKPILIGVTGSVGKSSTKEAIALILRSKFSVRSNRENYNNEIGIPLTIIGAKSGKRSVFGWLAVVMRWVRVVFFSTSYPKIVVLELGIDRPGDMAYLLSFLPIRIGVMTNVSSSHLEFFQTIGHIGREKGLLLKQLPESGTAVVCADDALVMKRAEKTKAKVMTYGMGDAAMLHAEHAIVSSDANHFEGCRFKVSFDGKTMPVHLPLVVAQHHIQAILAGMAVGLALKLNPIDMIASARNFQSLPGRMRMIEGSKQSWIIDDTYNASPTSLAAALKTLASFQNGRRIAVLGDMLELGTQSESAHMQVARWIREYHVDVAVLVGQHMLLAHEALIQDGFAAKQCLWFENPSEAAKSCKGITASGDVILVKGSQGMRMEKITEALMAHPEQASKVLCRQSEDWKRKPFIA